MPLLGGASLLGPPFQGWWALAFWVQSAAAPPAALLVSLDALAAGGGASGPSASASLAVAIDPESLAGSGRQLPPQGNRRLLQATSSAAPWAYIVIPMRLFGDEGAAWNRIVFQARPACARCAARAPA